ASFLAGAVAAILLGGCSLLFESSSAAQDGGLRDDSGLIIDAGIVGDGGSGGDSGASADGGPSADAAVVDAAVSLDDAGNPPVTVTFTVPCQSLVDSAQCKCELMSDDGTTSFGPVSDNAVCTRMVASGTQVRFSATVTKIGSDISARCQPFEWVSGNTAVTTCNSDECTFAISSDTTVRASCTDDSFIGANP
ncbi:MAG: hypothetical protein JKY56_05805, partial [Kofleriaceae bacterium]|nr:hypothetical protein [Kofleriaceae bacterium]